MRHLVVAFTAFALCLPALAERRQSPPKQRGIRSTPMHKQQGEPSDTEPSPPAFNESASAYRPARGVK